MLKRRGEIRFNSRKFNPFQSLLLWLQIILARIGSIPLFFVYRLSFFVKKIFSFRLPLPRLRRGKGRPRKLPLIFYKWNQFKRYFKKKVSLKKKIALSIGLTIIIFYSYTYIVLIAAYQLPSPDKLLYSDKALTTEFLDRNGKLLYRLYEGRNRTLVKLNEVPPYLIQATIAAEDKNFYHHIGIDLSAIFRAFMSNLKNHPSANQLEGASTITQQLIKNTLLTPEKTYTRKIKEIILALWTEQMYSKDQILQMYLNEAPYGGPTWGIEAASETFFNKNTRDLTLAQAAYLSGLPASPTQFSPYGTNPELGKVRQKEVLRRMIEDKFIDQSQAELAFAEDLHLQPQINNIKAPHFVMYVKDLLSFKYGQRVVSQGGLKITTTLDLDTQEEAERIVAEEASKLTALNVKNAAAMIMDGKTGQILAMIGSKDYHEPKFGSFNVALSLRQPGSSIKVATYASAFKIGYSPGNTILDVPVIFRDNWGNSYSPVNYDGRYHGPVSIRTALGSSYNIPAVKLLATVGVEEMAKTAADMGITTFSEPKKYGLALTLGGAEVRLIDMMTLYGSLSQLGQRKTATPILKVTDSMDNTLEEYEDQSYQALTPQIAYLITNILTDNSARTPAFGVNSLLKFDGNIVAVKTGTTDNKRDNWTFGYSPNFVVGVWVGNNDNSPMNPSLTSGVTGAAPIWRKLTESMLPKYPKTSFTKPTGIAEAIIDGRRDLIVSGNIPKSMVRVAQREDKLTFSDPYSIFATPSAETRPAGAQARLPDGQAANPGNPTN